MPRHAPYPLPRRSGLSRRSGAKAAFTLIELSIVLVIIGLIVGGILGGKDLIRSAKIRKAVTQLNEYALAINTFDVKYNDLPGDIRASQAAQFGLATRAGTAGQGDGNGLIEGGAATGRGACGETILLWNDLTTAGFIPGKYSGPDGASLAHTCTATSNPSLWLPTFTLNNAAFVNAYSDDSALYFEVETGPTAIDSASQLSGVAATALSPLELNNIDNKIDDGMPLTGSVVATDANLGVTWNNNPNLATPAVPASGVCVSNATGNPYNLSTATGGNKAACAFRYQVR